jgi:AcrR family transcriptional regulator
MSTRDAAATRRRILQAALKEFAAKGISGARVDAIAARARTNKRMIYYYFGSKDGLFREILRQQLASGRDSRLTFDEMDVSERAVARQAIHLDMPDYVRLLMWEALETRSRKQPVIAEDERAALYAGLRARVEAAQAAGELPADLDPGQLVLTELAITMFPAAFPQVARMATGRAIDDPAFVEERSAFLERFMAHVAGRPVGT